jgi:GT2 family glycosyltransferase
MNRVGDVAPGPLTSILIVNWNTRELVLKCLESLPAGTGPDVLYETIVVDNGSVDGSPEALAERGDISLIRNDGNRGYAEAVNQAYDASKGDLVFLLNSDVELRPGTLSTLVRFLEEHPEAAGAAPLYLNPDGTPQPFHFRFPTFLAVLAQGSSVTSRLPFLHRSVREHHMLDDNFDLPRTVEQPSASCLLLRRSVLGQSVFDERYPIFFNDVELARRIAAMGRKLWVTPDAEVVHEGHASTRQLGNRLKRQYLGSLVLMLRETEPGWKVRLYQSLVLLQGAAVLALRRPDALALSELWGAASGRPGSLPLGPAGSETHARGTG